MNGYCAGIVLPEVHRAGASTAASGRMSTSVGTYSLRRTHYMAGIRAPQLSVDQQNVLIQRFREGDNDAKRKLVAHNMHLVVDFAKCYANRGLSLLDLVRVGTQGILGSLETFELKGDLTLSTHVGKCVRKSIEDAIMKRNSAAKSRAANQHAVSLVNVEKPRRT